MQNLAAPLRRRSVLAAALTVLTIGAAGCSKTKDPSLIGTFRMGEKVQAGPVLYTVLESEWKASLAPGGRAPSNRFLFLRVSITNTGEQEVAVPGLELRGPGDKTYTEVTENMEGVQGWLGLLRRVPPSKTETGYIVFDAPMAAYHLVVSDGGDIDKEQHALIEIPVHIE